MLDCDTEIAREYGLIKSQLRQEGKPIPDNDIWIAAIARPHNLVLVSRDDHFREIEGFNLEQWQAHLRRVRGKARPFASPSCLSSSRGLRSGSQRVCS